MVCRIGMRRLVTLSQGVPLRITIDGVVYERLIGADGAWLTGADGLPLYGRI